MTLYQTFKNAFTTKPTAPTQKQKAANNIAKVQLYRSQSDAKRFKLALASAESLYSPNREQLYRIYQEIDLDPHLTSVVESRRIKATSKDFKLVSTKGSKKKENEEAKKFFEGSWFPQFLTYAWESITYGYSLIQIEGIDEKGNITEVSLVPRQHVKPQLGIYVKNPGDLTGYDYLSDPWLVGVGKKDNLGLYMKVALSVLYKQHSYAAWLQFVEIFGMPIRLGKVNAGDPEKAQSMFQMLDTMGSNGFGVMDKDDEVEFVETAKGGNGNTHQLLIKEIDSQVSKAIYGQTMTTDNGSSKSQGEVHERVADERSDSDHQLLAFYINDHLIPKMIELGLPLQNLKFEWETVEDNSELFDRAIALMGQGYDVDSEWLTATFNIPILGKKEATEASADATAASESEDDAQGAEKPDKPTEEPEKGDKE